MDDSSPQRRGWINGGSPFGVARSWFESFFTQPPSQTTFQVNPSNTNTTPSKPALSAQNFSTPQTNILPSPYAPKNETHQISDPGVSGFRLPSDNIVILSTETYAQLKARAEANTPINFNHNSPQHREIIEDSPWPGIPKPFPSTPARQLYSPSPVPLGHGRSLSFNSTPRPSQSDQMFSPFPSESRGKTVTFQTPCRGERSPVAPQPYTPAYRPGNPIPYTPGKSTTKIPQTPVQKRVREDDDDDLPPVKRQKVAQPDELDELPKASIYGGFSSTAKKILSTMSHTRQDQIDNSHVLPKKRTREASPPPSYSMTPRGLSEERQTKRVRYENGSDQPSKQLQETFNEVDQDDWEQSDELDLNEDAGIFRRLPADDFTEAIPEPKSVSENSWDASPKVVSKNKDETLVSGKPKQKEFSFQIRSKADFPSKVEVPKIVVSEEPKKKSTSPIFGERPDTKDATKSPFTPKENQASLFAFALDKGVTAKSDSFEAAKPLWGNPTEKVVETKVPETEKIAPSFSFGTKATEVPKPKETEKKDEPKTTSEVIKVPEVTKTQEPETPKETKIPLFGAEMKTDLSSDPPAVKKFAFSAPVPSEKEVAVPKFGGTEALATSPFFFGDAAKKTDFKPLELPKATETPQVTETPKVPEKETPKVVDPPKATEPLRFNFGNELPKIAETPKSSGFSTEIVKVPEIPKIVEAPKETAKAPEPPKTGFGDFAPPKSGFGDWTVPELPKTQEKTSSGFSTETKKVEPPKSGFGEFKLDPPKSGFSDIPKIPETTTKTLSFELPKSDFSFGGPTTPGSGFSFESAGSLTGKFSFEAPKETKKTEEPIKSIESSQKVAEPIIKDVPAEKKKEEKVTQETPKKSGFGIPDSNVAPKFAFGSSPDSSSSLASSGAKGFGFAGSDAGAVKGFGFGDVKTSPTPVIGFGSEPTKFGSSFGSLPTPSTTKAPDSTASGQTAESDLFSFGSKSSTPKESFFGSEPPKASEVSTSFSFGSSSPAPTSSPFSTTQPGESPFGNFQFGAGTSSATPNSFSFGDITPTTTTTAPGTKPFGSGLFSTPAPATGGDTGFSFDFAATSKPAPATPSANGVFTFGSVGKEPAASGSGGEGKRKLKGKRTGSLK